MKLYFLAVPALIVAASAGAQEQAAPAAKPAAKPAEAPAKLTIDTPIEALMADEKAKAIVDANLPGIADHPAYGQFKAMSLKAVQPFSGGVITDEALTKIAADLAKL